MLQLDYGMGSQTLVSRSLQSSALIIHPSLSISPFSPRPFVIEGNHSTIFADPSCQHGTVAKACRVLEATVLTAD